MWRWALVCAVGAAALSIPSTASGAALVPLAPPGAWLAQPVHAAAPQGDPRLFVVERDGAVRLVKDGELQPTPFIIVPNVDTFGERGLMSIAFAPDYATSGLFYVFYMATAADALDPDGEPGDVRIVEYRRSASDPDVADPSSARLVLKQTHPHTNHNGGQLAFGPDGFLYITIGDGVQNSMDAQDPETYLGKVLRIDPRPTDTGAYSVPASNPFVGAANARPEIYALGLRNPYRASFTPSGALVVADVGADTWEEINAGILPGANLGWPDCEGACSPPPPSGFTDPVFQYANASAPPETTGCAVIGGLVVRDESLGDLTGRYLYGDLCRADLRTLNLDVAGADPRPADLSVPPFSLRGFGEDAGGCVYVMTTVTVYRVAPDAAAPKKCPTAPSSPVPVTPVDSGSGSATATTTATATATATDTTRPGLRVRSGRQKLGRYVVIRATCLEDCVMRATGMLAFSPKEARAARARLIGTRRSARAGTRVRLRLRLSNRVLRRARKAIRAKRRVSARVTLTATDATGHTTRKATRSRLIRQR